MGRTARDGEETEPGHWASGSVIDQRVLNHKRCRLLALRASVLSGRGILHPSFWRRSRSAYPGIESDTAPLRVAVISLLGEILMSLMGRPMVLRSLVKGLHVYHLEDDYRSLVSEQMRYRGYLRSFLSTLRCCAFKDASEDYRIIGSLELPVLMILGSEDPFIKSATRERIGELIPRLQYKEILDTGHIPHFERPEEVSRLLIHFISSASW